MPPSALVLDFVPLLGELVLEGASHPNGSGF